MTAVVALYTITSLNDKYAVSKAKYNGSRLTFLMAAGTTVFLIFMLPFADTHFAVTPLSVLCVLLIALSKYLEFAMSARILIDMSVFELKAWLGIVTFLSYFTDVFMYSEKIAPVKLMCIALTAGGLIMIAKEGRKKVNYKRIALPLVLYLASRFGYGFVMKAGETVISSTMTLFFALIILALAMLPSAKPWLIPKDSPEGVKGLAIVLGCKLPNALGLMGENAIVAASLTSASLLQPMILIVIFVMGLFDKSEKLSALRLGGSALVILGILGFELI